MNKKQYINICLSSIGRMALQVPPEERDKWIEDQRKQFEIHLSMINDSFDDENLQS